MPPAQLAASAVATHWPLPGQNAQSGVAMQSPQLSVSQLVLVGGGGGGAHASFGCVSPEHELCAVHVQAPSLHAYHAQLDMPQPAYATCTQLPDATFVPSVAE